MANDQEGDEQPDTIGTAQEQQPQRLPQQQQPPQSEWQQRMDKLRREQAEQQISGRL